MADVIQVQEAVTKWLESMNLFSYSVFFVPGKFLKITFVFPFEIEKLESVIGYNNFADKSGLVEIPEENVVVLSGMTLKMFFKLIEKWEQ